MTLVGIAVGIAAEGGRSMAARRGKDSLMHSSN